MNRLLRRAAPAFLAAGLCVLQPAPILARQAVSVNEAPNYSVNFKVSADEKTLLTPRVAMELRGADEIASVTSLLQERRYLRFRGDGQLIQIGSDIVWKPRALNAALSYEVAVPHEREPGKFDSYGKRDWVITRTADLFPRKRIEFTKPAKSYTTVEFDLPEGWDVATAMPELAPGRFRAYPTEDTRYDWPTGWLIYGKIRSDIVGVGDVRITLAYPEAFVRPSRSKDFARVERRSKYLNWFAKKLAHMEEIYRKVIPLMMDFLPEYAKEFLVVIGKDPMWQGGLSGENSLYLNRGVPNIVTDKSSTLIHEYFHVCAGFEKDKRDAEWFVEGLAEYFSIRLLHEAGLTTKEEFAAGIEKHRLNGSWGLNLARTQKESALYNNSTVVLFTLDEMIRAKTGGQKSLKTALKSLADEERPVGTERFQAELEKVYGDSLKNFFKAHVYGGKVPDYQSYLKK